MVDLTSDSFPLFLIMHAHVSRQQYSIIKADHLITTGSFISKMNVNYFSVSVQTTKHSVIQMNLWPLQVTSYETRNRESGDDAWEAVLSRVVPSLVLYTLRLS